MRQLDVYWNGVLAGTLTEQTAGKGYSFMYDTSYLSGDSPPITLTLPKTEVPYNSETLFPFFANLLPEGALRCSLLPAVATKKNKTKTNRVQTLKTKQKWNYKMFPTAPVWVPSCM